MSDLRNKPEDLLKLCLGLRGQFAVSILFALIACLSAQAQVSVTTWRNDIGRTGQNLNETVLNTSDVNPTQFGKLFSQTVDGYVYAQPLYVPNVIIGGQTHNVIFVATEHDSVYAFDADNNGGVNANSLWFASMLSTAHGAASGATTVSSTILGTDIIPEVGITGTPVIDPASGTLYVVSMTEEGASFFLRLHALDITSGAEKLGGPVVITASVLGTGSGSIGGTLVLDTEWQNQRPGLLLLNGIVYIGLASHGDNGPWHGWVLGYNAQTLQQTGVFCTSPNGVGGGIWMGGAGLAADVLDPVNHPYGRMFVATGNGDFAATPPYSLGMDYGDSILNLDLTNGVPSIHDDFTPLTQASLDANDFDEGSAGILIVPTQTAGSNPDLLVQGGKAGVVYLLNRDNLGGYTPAGDKVVQEIIDGVGNVGTWGTPAYWNETVFYWGQNDSLKAYTMVNGQLIGPSEVSAETYGFPGSSPSISANGNTQGIVWSIESDAYYGSGPAVLQAHSASNVSATLYSSNTNLSRDNPGPAVKFTVPTVANGKVYVGAQHQVSIFGLLNNQMPAVSPVISPGSETFNGSITVSMTDATPGAVIYYTVDGSIPTVASSVYTTPITITSTTTVQALASATGYLQSGVTSATYANSSQTKTPTFNPGSGSFTQPISITISDSTAGASIYYTTDGTTPTTSSTLYAGPVQVSSTETVHAIAVASGLGNSAVASATYTVIIGQTGINFPVGFAGTAGLVILNGSTDLDDSRLQLTNGGVSQAGSAWYYQPVNIQTFTTEFSYQLSNPAGEGMTFAIQGNNIWSLGYSGGGLGYQTIPSSVAVKFDLYSNAGEGSDSTGLYTDGNIPTVPAIDLSNSGINLHSDDTMDVVLSYNGSVLSMTIRDLVTGAAYSTSWTVNIPALVGGNTAYVGFTGGTGALTSSQKVLTWVYTNGAIDAPVTTSPSFTPPGGSYPAAQSVSITSSTSGATIHYTLDGTTPTTSSLIYSAPIAVNTSETLNAIAVAPNYTPSVDAVATYTIAPLLPAPALSPAPGTYSAAQSVIVSDSASGVTIYYTTDGTAPTSSSSVYTGPIAVSASETLLAIAGAAGYNNSPAAGGAYTIASLLPAPVITPSGGQYNTSQTVAISDGTAGSTIHYTMDGSIPTGLSTTYTAPITVSSSETLQAIAVKTGYINSSVATAVYTIGSVNPTYINYPAGQFTASNLSLNYGAVVTSGLLQLTDGGTAENRSAWFSTSVPVQSFITDFTFEQLNASADGMTFTIQGNNVWELGDSGGGLGYEGIPNSVAVKFDLYSNAGEGADSTGLYTNGAEPTAPSIDLSSAGINLHSGDIMSAHMVYDGTNLTMTLTDTVTGAFVTEVFPVNIPSIVGGNSAYVGFTGGTGGVSATQNVLSWTYVSPAVQTASTPTFSPAAGTYATTQSVAISDTTAGATIYYTTNGTTPTTSSAVYSAPMLVSTTEKIEAMAVASGNSNSLVATAAYAITPVLPAPTFSPAGGTYSTAQSITISDATTGTTIYYTTNGTTPTTSSTKYTVPITVGATETLQAIAVDTGYTNSPVTTAAYTISVTNPTLPSPTFSPSGGTYSGAQTVTISDATSGTTIYYTTNGTAPSVSSSIYTGPVTVTSSETLEAIAVETGYTNSVVATASYLISTGSTTYINYVSGGFTASKLSLNYGASVAGGGLKLTDGGTAEVRSAWFTTPVPVQSFVTDFTFQQLNASADGMTFTIQGDNIWELGYSGAGLGYQGIPSSVAVKFDLYSNAGEGSDSTGLYTNGAAPTTPSVDLTSTPINLHSGDVMHAHMVYDGTNLTMTLTDTVTNGTVTEVFPVNIPSVVGASTAYVGFTGGTGGLTATQNVLSWSYSAP